MAEPSSSSNFSFDFEGGDRPLETTLTKSDLQKLMLEEMVYFRPGMASLLRGGRGGAGASAKGSKDEDDVVVRYFRLCLLTLNARGAC